MKYELRTVSTEADHSSKLKNLTTSEGTIFPAVLESDYKTIAAFDTLEEARKECEKHSSSARPVRANNCWVLDVECTYIAVVDDDGYDTGDYDGGHIETPESWDDFSDDDDDEEE